MLLALSVKASRTRTPRCHVLLKQHLSCPSIKVEEDRGGVRVSLLIGDKKKQMIVGKDSSSILTHEEGLTGYSVDLPCFLK